MPWLQWCHRSGLTQLPLHRSLFDFRAGHPSSTYCCAWIPPCSPSCISPHVVHHFRISGYLHIAAPWNHWHFPALSQLFFLSDHVKLLGFFLFLTTSKGKSLRHSLSFSWSRIRPVRVTLCSTSKTTPQRQSWFSLSWLIIEWSRLSSLGLVATFSLSQIGFSSPITGIIWVKDSIAQVPSLVAKIFSFSCSNCCFSALSTLIRLHWWVKCGNQFLKLLSVRLKWFYVRINWRTLPEMITLPSAHQSLGRVSKPDQHKVLPQRPHGSRPAQKIHRKFDWPLTVGRLVSSLVLSFKRWRTSNKSNGQDCKAKWNSQSDWPCAPRLLELHAKGTGRRISSAAYPADPLKCALVVFSPILIFSCFEWPDSKKKTDYSKHMQICSITRHLRIHWGRSETEKSPRTQISSSSFARADPSFILHPCWQWPNRQNRK